MLLAVFVYGMQSSLRGLKCLEEDTFTGIRVAELIL